MARRKKMSVSEQLRALQEEYICCKKHCEELAGEIDRLAKLQQEEMAQNLISALAKSSKSYEDVMAFIQGKFPEDGT